MTATRTTLVMVGILIYHIESTAPPYNSPTHISQHVNTLPTHHPQYMYIDAVHPRVIMFEQFQMMSWQ